MVIEALSLGTTPEEIAYYDAVKALYLGIDIEPASYDPIKKTHTGYGRITFVLPLFQDQTPGVGVVFKDVYIDKNGQMLSGYAETIYKEENWTTQMVNIDAFFRGGILVERIMNEKFGAFKELGGIIGDTTNIVVNFKGDGTVDNITVTYTVPNEAGSTQEVVTVDEGLIQKVPESKENSTATVDYYIIKDADNVYYGINLTDGSKIPLGRYDANISKIMADINRNKVDYEHKIKFSDVENANYAFDPADDKYANNLIYSSHYNELENSHEYKLCWKFMQAGGTTDRVKVNIPDGIIRNTDNLKFIITQNNTELAYTEGGTGDIELTLMPPPTAGEYSILAVVKTVVEGKDTWKLAGRLDILAREHKTYNVTLVPLASGKAIDDTKKAAIRQYLNSTWNKYGISWEVDVDNAFYVNAADDDYNKQFINGFTEQDWADAWADGDEFFSQYTSVQEDINRRYNTYAKGINKYDNTHMYVFILPEDKTREFGQVGDMPLGKQWGYLFVNEFGKEADKQKHYRTLSHELGHGRTALPHTFAGDKPEHRVPKGETTNLMDYSSGTDLVRAQWDMVHNPAIFTPLQSDGDALAIENLIVYYTIKEDEKQYGFLSAAGKPITIPNVTKVLFNEDGGVLNFVSNGKLYYGVFIKEGQRFLGYISKEHASILDEHNYLRTLEFVQAFEEKKYTGIMNASVGKTILAFAKFNYLNTYWDCVQKYTWVNNFQSLDYIGVALPPFIPDGATMISESGRHCVDFSEVKEGVGFSVFMNLIDIVTESQRPQLIELANYLSETLENKRFTFYHPDLNDVYIGSNYFNKEILLFLRTNKIYSKALFETAFPVPVAPTVDFDVIFSTSNLWQGIIPTYNINSTDFIKSTIQLKRVIYQYTFDDLKYRKKYIDLGGAIAQGIINGEQDGLAPAMTQQNYYDQYLACFGTESAVFAWTSFAANSSKDVLMAMFAQRLAAEYGGVAIRTVMDKMAAISAENFRKFVTGAVSELLGNIVANELLKSLGIGVTYSWTDICTDAVIAGIKNVVIPVVSDDASKTLNLVYNRVGDCVIGLDINTVDDLFSIRNQEKPLQVLSTGLIQCFVPAIAGGLCEKFLPYLSQKIKFTTKARTFFKSTNLPDDKIGEAIYNSLNLDVVLKNRNLNARNLYKQVLSSVDGAKAMDILLDAKFDISKLTSKNFERLARIVSKYGDNQTDEMVKLFAETTDVNRMLVSMDNMVKSVDDYKKMIAAVKNHEQFQGTIKIGQTNFNFEDFFETTSDAFEYYHKEALGVHYFAKVKDGSGYMYAVKISEMTGNSTVQNFFKGYIMNEIDKEFKAVNIIDINDEN